MRNLQGRVTRERSPSSLLPRPSQNTPFFFTFNVPVKRSVDDKECQVVRARPLVVRPYSHRRGEQAEHLIVNVLRLALGVARNLGVRATLGG